MRWGRQFWELPLMYYPQPLDVARWWRWWIEVGILGNEWLGRYPVFSGWTTHGVWSWLVINVSLNISICYNLSDNKTPSFPSWLTSPYSSAAEREIAVKPQPSLGPSFESVCGLLFCFFAPGTFNVTEWCSATTTSTNLHKRQISRKMYKKSGKRKVQLCLGCRNLAIVQSDCWWLSRVTCSWPRLSSSHVRVCHHRFCYSSTCIFFFICSNIKEVRQSTATITRAIRSRDSVNIILLTTA